MPTHTLLVQLPTKRQAGRPSTGPKPIESCADSKRVSCRLLTLCEKAVSREGQPRGSSRMMGNYRVRFQGEGAPATVLPLPGDAEWIADLLGMVQTRLTFW